MAGEGEAAAGDGGNGNGALCLHSYWRSSAAYRVRIGLNLKGLKYDIAPVHLVRGGGEQHAPGFAAINPQELVPVLQHGHRNLRQSLAILYETVWQNPAEALRLCIEVQQRAPKTPDIDACIERNRARLDSAPLR